MTEYRRGAHTVHEIHLHLVWTAKYRKPVLVGDAATRMRDLMREIRGKHDVKIMKWQKESASELLPRVHRVISLLKRWLMGTHQGAVSHKHLAENPPAEANSSFASRSKPWLSNRHPTMP